MLYFEIRPALQRLDNTEKGRLFDAILDYAADGITPEFDGMLGMAWDFIRPNLDRDAKRYNQKSIGSQYAVYVRECKRKGREPVSREDWVITIQQAETDDIE